MKKRVILVYDCPLDKCDKLWVYHGLLEHGYEVKVVDWPFAIGHLDQRGKIGVLLALLVIMVQSFWVALTSRPDDIIFCWLQKSGIYCNKFAGGKRKIISYNWLTPRPKKSTRKLYASALENSNVRIVINAIENREKNLTAYGARDVNNITYIPDVYEENAVFQEPRYEKSDFAGDIEQIVKSFDGKYCFMGGRANRDWQLFLQAAQKCPDILFVGVAAASDWDKSVVLPDNVMMRFDTTADEYYRLMSNAYLAVYPLKQERVSGLINILKGALEGIPVLITELPVTAMYYDEQDKDMLFPMGDCDAMCNRIRQVYAWKEEQYISKVTHMQEFIRQHFSPEMASCKIDEMIQSLVK